MSIIHEIYLAVNGGASLEDVIPLGADITAWRRILDNYNPNAGRKKAKRTRPDNGRRSKRSSQARMESALGWATLELVQRVNGHEDDIPFTGEVSPSWKRNHTPSAAEVYSLPPEA